MTTPITIVDSRDWRERFIVNARAKVKLASTYVGPLVGALGGIACTLWKAMNPEQQTGLVGAIGLGPLWSAILLANLTHWAAVFKPAASGVISPQLAEALSEIGHLKLNAELVRLGYPEVPAVTPALTAVPAIRLLQPAAVSLASTPPAPATATVTAKFGPPTAADPFEDETSAPPKTYLQQFMETHPNLTEAEATTCIALLRKGTAP